jgi:hypothetical protein
MDLSRRNDALAVHIFSKAPMREKLPSLNVRNELKETEKSRDTDKTSIEDDC